MKLVVRRISTSCTYLATVHSISLRVTANSIFVITLSFSLSLSLSLSFSCLSVRAVSNRLKIHSGEYLESSTSKRLDIDSFCSTSVNPPFQRTTNRSDLLSFFLLFSFFFLRTHESVSIDCSNRVNESST